MSKKHWLDEIKVYPANKSFEKMVAHTWRVEGGFSNHDSDPGGKTRFGITEAVARDHGYEGKMEELPEPLALAIYREDYFDGPGYHRVAEYSFKIAKELFDCGVNIGPVRASLMLQRALTLLNRRGKDYADLKPDGVVGDKTIEALAAYLKKRGKRGVGVLLKALLTQRGAYYMDLAASAEKFEDFLNGWLDTRVDMEAICRE